MLLASPLFCLQGDNRDLSFSSSEFLAPTSPVPDLSSWPPTSAPHFAPPCMLVLYSVLPQGTIVVVTHNRRFCELLEPTHLATVLGEPGAQTVQVEERPLRASDWEGADDGDSASGTWLPLLLACIPWPALLLKSPTATPYDNSHPTLFFFPVCPSPSPSSPLSLPSGPSR